MQKKDVIYIDVEDDITAIIGKVKDAKEKIVALVPPKRIGVLQSAVNLRLLARTADTASKRLVIITSNTALAGLAANAKIPVAKNLQSRPELAEIPILAVDDNDVIDGKQLPVGMYTSDSTDDTKSKRDVPDSTIEDINIEDAMATEAAPSKKTAKSSPRSAIKVPDFGTFRKRLVLIISGVMLLLAFLIWAIWFAPRAHVTVSTKTIDQILNAPISLGAALDTDSEAGTLRTVVEEQEDTQTIEFDATGSKDVGERASGTVTFSTNAITMLGTTIAAGTNLTTSSGLVFTTTQSVTLSMSNFTGAATGIVASESGPKYNGASGSVSGVPSGISAEITDATSGGTEKIIKVVTQGDVEKAKAQLEEQKPDDIKTQLQRAFDDGVIVIENSFVTKGGDAQSAPAIGQEASTGKAKLTREVTYTMMGVKASDLDSFLDSAFKTTLTNKDEQRVYDNGRKDVAFEGFKQEDKKATAVIKATAQIGPRIDDDKIKEMAKGKRTGELIGDIKAIDGVSDVEVDLSPFWVGSVPNDKNKISLEFKRLKDD